MSSSSRENHLWVLVFCKEDESYTAVKQTKIEGLPETGKELQAELDYFDPILSKEVSKKWLVTVIDTGTEKEMKRKVPEFAARLKQAKEKTSLNEPRKRKPTEKILEHMENLQNHERLGEEEERRKNSKSKNKVKDTDVSGGKENVRKNETTASIEETAKGIDKGKVKNKSSKRTAATASVGEENQSKRAKKAKSDDAKINASKEAAMKFFTDKDILEPEVTEVDVWQTRNLKLPSKSIQQKEKGGKFRQMVNREYPEFSGDPADNLGPHNSPASSVVPNSPSTSHPVPINNSSTNRLAPHHPPANLPVPNTMSQPESSRVPTSSTVPASNAIMQSSLQIESPSNQPTGRLPDNAAPYSTLLRPELVSQLVSALQTVNYPPELSTVVEDTADNGQTSNSPGETNLSARSGLEDSECQKCKPIIDQLNKEISELRGRQLPDSSSEIVSFLEKLLFALKNGNQEIQVSSTFHGSPHVQQEKQGKSGMTPLIPESGVFIPTVALGAILDQSNKDPNNLFHKLVDHFFSQHVLATSTATSQRVSKSLKRPLDQNIVKAIEAFVMSAAKRWNAVPLTHAQIIKKLTNKCSAAERAVKNKLYTVPTGNSQDS